MDQHVLHLEVFLDIGWFWIAVELWVKQALVFGGSYIEPYLSSMCRIHRHRDAWSLTSRSDRQCGAGSTKKNLRT